MSKQMKQGLTGSAIAVAVLILIGATWLSLPRGESAEPIREIVLDARDAAFGGDNPTLHLQAGERVRFVVRNTDSGVMHSITIPGLDSEVRHIAWGEEVVFEVTVPEGGSFSYVCPQHAPKMQGKIVVVRQ
jgi:plastocyanin